MSTSVQSLIVQAAQSGDVDPTLALAVAQHESGLNQSAVGTSGEQGVFQIMPSTAQDLGIDPTNLQENIAGGTALLSQLLAQFGGDHAKALAAYNCGATCVNNAISKGGDNWFAYVPASTQEYVINILGPAGFTSPLSQAAGAVAAASPSPDSGAMASVVPAIGIDTTELLALSGLGILAVLALRG